MYIQQGFTCLLLSGGVVYVVTPFELMNDFHNNKIFKNTKSSYLIQF